MEDMSLDSKVEVKKVEKVDKNLVTKFNELLDEGVEWDEAQGQKYLDDKNNALFVANVGDEIVGYLTAHRLQRFDKRRAEVLLYEVGVDENFRRRGIGKALVEGVKRWAREVEADEVWVVTEMSNEAAVHLYQTCGGKKENPGEEAMYVIKV